MKKILFLLLSFFTINMVYAFDIDMDKIEVNSRGKSLVETLDSSYKIEVDSFNKKIVYNDKAIEAVKNILKIVSSDKDETTKKKEYTKNMYIDKNQGGSTLASALFRDTYFTELQKFKVVGGYVSDIKTVPFNNDVLAFVYVKDAKVNGKKNEIVYTYWLKELEGEYKVYYPWITVNDKLDSFFERVAKEEEKGNTIGGTYNAVSLNSGSVKVNEETLNELFNNNKASVVQVTGMSAEGTNMYGSGFFLREGVIATTWSLFQQFLTESNYVYVSDAFGNTYDVDGVIAAQVDYDIVILKLKKEVGKIVNFANSGSLKTDDNLFTINSKYNDGFSISYGTFVSLDNGRLKNLFALSSSEVGSALFNKEGNVVGFAVADLLNSELSYGNSTDYLKDLQKLLLKQEFASIKSTKVDQFKEKYYLKYTSEQRYNSVSKSIWDRFSKIGNLNNNIKFDLLKASYQDRILSLRYRTLNTDMLDSFYLISSFLEELDKEGFVLVQNEESKKVYENADYKIVIKENFDYLIIIIMEK